VTGFLVRLVVTAVALWVATALVGGLVLEAGSPTEQALTMLGVALVFGLLNAVIKPVLTVLTLPLFILTLGLITFVINALVLLLTGWVSDQLGLAFRVEGFGAALLGAVIVSLVSFALNLVLPDRS
jgi:putative membrane protein